MKKKLIEKEREQGGNVVPIKVNRELLFRDPLFKSDNQYMGGNIFLQVRYQQLIFIYKLSTVRFQKLSIPPPWKGFFLRTPSPPPNWKFQSSFLHLLKFLGL